jgi:hypothetical protein
MSGFGREGRDGNIPLDSSVASTVSDGRGGVVILPSTLPILNQGRGPELSVRMGEIIAGQLFLPGCTRKSKI